MNTIFQIYHDKTLIPAYVKQHITTLNPHYEYKFIDFNEGINIIRNNIHNESLKNKILYCMDNYPRICHKSDLLRYCLLYIYGGIYLDVDLKPDIPFDKMKPNGITFFTSFGRGGTPYTVNKTLVYPITSNGILISYKNNPILLDLINHSITNKNLFNKQPKYRGENVFFLYNYLNQKCKNNNIILKPFNNIQIDNQNIYLVNHILIPSKKIPHDVIVDKDKILIYADDPLYSFKRQTSSYI